MEFTVRLFLTSNKLQKLNIALLRQKGINLIRLSWRGHLRSCFVESTNQFEISNIHKFAAIIWVPAIGNKMNKQVKYGLLSSNWAYKDCSLHCGANSGIVEKIEYSLNKWKPSVRNWNVSICIRWIYGQTQIALIFNQHQLKGSPSQFEKGPSRRTIPTWSLVAPRHVFRNIFNSARRFVGRQAQPHRQSRNLKFTNRPFQIFLHAFEEMLLSPPTILTNKSVRFW